MSIDDAIARGRAALLPLLRDTATITRTPFVSDGRGGQLPGTPTTSTTVANVQRTIRAEEQAIADRLGVISPAVIRLPVGTAVYASDTITVGGHVFQVVSPLVDTIALTLPVLCKELTAPAPPATTQAGYRSPLWILGMGA